MENVLVYFASFSLNFCLMFCKEADKSLTTLGLSQLLVNDWIGFGQQNTSETLMPFAST